jgi:alpha-ribazole phosphatase
MMTVDLVRHGETVAPGRLLGRTDAPLSELGLSQLMRQAERRAWRTIVASPLARALHGAEQMALATDAALVVDAGWREMDFGAWDGEPLATLRGDPATAEAFDAFLINPEGRAPPGGETWHAFSERLSAALDRLAAHSVRGAPVAVVTHAGAIRGVVAITCGLAFADLWRLRIGYGTRVTLGWGRDPGGRLWGEIIEIIQP